MLILVTIWLVFWLLFLLLILILSLLRCNFLVSHLFLPDPYFFSCLALLAFPLLDLALPCSFSLLAIYLHSMIFMSQYVMAYFAQFLHDLFLLRFHFQKCYYSFPKSMVFRSLVQFSCLHLHLVILTGIVFSFPHISLSYFFLSFYPHIHISNSKSPSNLLFVSSISPVSQFLPLLSSRLFPPSNRLVPLIAVSTCRTCSTSHKPEM